MTTEPKAKACAESERLAEIRRFHSIMANDPQVSRGQREDSQTVMHLLEIIDKMGDALEFYAGKRDGKWVDHVCDSYSGLRYAFDWNGDTQDEPYEVAERALSLIGGVR